MNARQVNSLLWAGAGVLGVGAVAAVLGALVMPVESVEVAGVGKVAAPATRAATTSPAVPSLGELEKVWAINLRQNLGEAAPAPAVAVTPQPVAPTAAAAGLPVSLVGTIGTSLAMLKTPSNSVEVCGVGETAAGGVTVVAVRPAEVDVRYNGQVVTLAKPKDAE